MNRILSVSQLNNYIKNVFDDELLIQNITVEGEVFECKFSGGNTYITLKEGEYSLYCVKFGSKAEFSAGDKIRVFGSMKFYPKGGRATFVMLNASAVGKGELLVKLNELKERLKKEGVFDNKKTLPRFVQRIALVTSVEGAVIHDFMEVLGRNGCSYIDVDAYGVKVQGAGAEHTIKKAIAMASEKDYDVLVLARGGGSSVDLSCFNTEVVARSVFDCPFATVSAVGHEVDYTLSDFSASLRAGTPSIAAELIVRNNEAFLARFFDLLGRLRTYAESKLSANFDKAKRNFTNISLGCFRKTAQIKDRLLSADNAMYHAAYKRILSVEAALKMKPEKLKSTIENRMSSVENKLKLTSAVLDKLSPLKIISDGYAKVLSDDKSVVSVEQVNIGDRIKVVLKDGVLTAEVLGKGGFNGT